MPPGIDATAPEGSGGGTGSAGGAGSAGSGTGAGTGTGTGSAGTGTGSAGGAGTGTGTGTGSAGGAGTGTGSGGTVTGPVYPTAHPRIYLAANKTRLAAALAAHTTEATTFQNVVDAWVGGADQWGMTAWQAALLGQLTGQAKYCTAAIAAIDTQVSTAESAIAAGNAPTVADDSYLYVGDDIGDLALVYDWCHDTVSSSQKTRWLAYADQAVSNVWHPTTASWGGHTMAWSGWATNDPSDNYYYSFLRATMLLGLATRGEDPQADTWLTEFRATKLTSQLFPTFNSDLVGGGSREGTSYGVAMRRLWELYDWWHATTGEALATQTPQTRASLLSAIHQTVPTLDRVAPTGDQARDSTAPFFDYNRQYIAELVSLFPNDTAAPRAAYLNAHSSIPKMSEQFMAVYDFLYAPTMTAQPLTGLDTAYYATGIGQLYARSGWDTHATWVNLIAGPYTESHAHQDQGALMLYKDGWLATDAVIGSRSGLRQETNAHGVVRVDKNGSAVPQVASTTSKLAALQQGTGYVYAAADLTPAYGGNSAVTKMQREIVYLQPDVVIVYDRVTSATGTQQVWQLPSPAAPSISGNTASFAAAGHTLHVQRLVPASATSSAFSYTNDASGDYNSGYRLDETVSGGDQRYLHVLAIDGAAPTVSQLSATSVSVTLASGQVAVVTFQANTLGGASLTLGGTAIALGSTVHALAE